MPTGYETVQAIVSAVNTATNAMSVRVAFVLSEIARTAGEGLNGEQVKWVEDNLAPVVATLDATAKDAGAPIVPLPPVDGQPTIPGPLLRA